jgi:hypothetical protein
MIRLRLHPATLCALTTCLVVVSPTRAQAPVQLAESFPPGYEYHVSSRVDLTGSLTLPADKPGAAARTLAVRGKSAIEYDERVLAQEKDNRVAKTVRLYRRVDFQRQIGDQPQESTIRPEVRRLVLLRLGQAEVPFSPDGPLMWSEIDLVRTDVFTPALMGLLPAGAVRPGDRWTAALGAVQELTDLERIEEGSVGCKYAGQTMVGNRRHARVEFGGSVRGLGEDGTSRHTLEGYLFFDLESRHISYVSLSGVQQLLDKDGKVVGKVEGNFVLTRQPHTRARELSDEGLRGKALEPNDDNTQLLYDNPELGVRLLHPRRWHPAGVRGRQLGLDEKKGSGLLLTLEPLKQVPTAAAFLKEARTYIQGQKATVVRQEAPVTVQGPPRTVERFALESVMGSERVVLVYYVLRQAAGGATLVARLLPADLPALQRELERIARSVVITRAPAP